MSCAKLYELHLFIGSKEFLLTVTPFYLIFNFLLEKKHTNLYAPDYITKLENYLKKSYGNYMGCGIAL